MMTADEIQKLITEAMPLARIRIDDLRKDGNHYSVTVEDPAFRGMSLPEQHRMVFAALEGRVGGLLRGITLTTIAPQQRGGRP